MADIKRKINTDKCVQCQKCEEVCLEGAISMHSKDDRTWMEIDENMCNSCDACYQVCPNDAIEESEQ